MKFIFLTLFSLCTIILHAQTWQAVGNGTNNSSHGLLVWNNKLIDLGSFNNPCNRVAAWNGTSWECLGGGVGIVARAGTVWNGNLVVVGDFWNVQQPCTNCNGVAMWDGTQWTNIGAGFNNDVLCVTVWNGDLVVAGDFTQSNGQPCSRIARWTGTTWEQIGPSNAFNNDIRAITEFEGELWIGGDFTNVGGCTACDRLVKWSGTAWVGGDSGVDIQGGVDNTVRVLYVNPYDGKLYMGGHFTDLNLDGVINTNCKGVAVYDGSNWESLGTGVNDYVRAINEYNGNIVVGGYFTQAGSITANRIAKWNPVTQTWSAMGLGFNGSGIDEYVKSATVWNGIFFAGGAYTIAEGNSMNHIAQWYETPAAAPTSTINAEQTSQCTGGCFNFTDASTYGPTSWNWSFPGGSITSSTLQNPPPVCYSTAGTYTISLTACNSIGCNTTTQTINVSSAPTVAVNSPTICAGSSAVLTANPSVSGGSFLWSPGGQTTSSITVSPTTTTTYTVTFSSPGCGSTSANATVTVNSTAPTLTVNSPTICSGQTTTLTATPSVSGGTYSWYPGGQTTPSITVNPVSTEIYTVTYSLNGCSSSPMNSTVTVNSAPSVSVDNQTICAGSSATLTATPSVSGGTYVWSPGGQTTNSITVSPGSTANYSVIYSQGGCPSQPASGTITVNPLPIVSVNNSTICQGSSATLIALPSITGGTFSWSPSGETTSSITVTPSISSNYTVVYTLAGCSSIPTSSSVTVNPIPSVTTGDQTICSGNAASLTAIPSINGGTYLWTPGNLSGSVINVSPSATTSYSVIYTLNGCTSSAASANVIVNPTPTVTSSNQTICAGSTADLTAVPSIAGGTYLWNPGAETTQTISVNPTATTTFSVVYTLNNCVSAPASSVVTVNPIPEVSVNDLTVCDGMSGSLVATPSINGGTFLWSPEGQTSSSISVSPSTSSTYSVVYTLNGCSSTTSTGVVTVAPLPQTGISNTLNVLSAMENNGNYQWLDCFDNSVITGETNQSFSPSVNGNYAVEINLNGCLDTSDCIAITTLDALEIDSDFNLLVYPNPVDDVLIIQVENQFLEKTYTVKDNFGRIVSSGQILKSETAIDVSTLSPGLYHLTIENVEQRKYSIIKL